MNPRPGDPPPFDVCGPLPAPGITVLEASAGTGKTFTLTALVVRFLAEGIPLSAILAVTFTRIATGELRDRIRQRLVACESRLSAYLDRGVPVPEDDQVATVLAAGPRDEVAERRRRLSDAVAEFDAATIATTHGFCQLVIHGLGTAGDTAAGAELLEDPDDLVDEVVDDLYLRWALSHPALPFDRKVAVAAARQAVRNPDTRLVPAPGTDPPGLLSRLAGRARDEVRRRLAEGPLLTYDQLLVNLADTLDDPDRGPAACRRLRRLYQVVLVDEFQDTDPVQWRVMRRAFGTGTTTLVLIGDPKQAVYAFRGADVYAYLDAAQQAEAVYTLSENWRSDQAFLDATDALLAPLQFGHPGIPFRRVKAPAGRQAPGVRGLPSPAPVRVRLVTDKQPGVALTQARGFLQKSSLVDWIAGDVAADVAAALRSGAQVRTDGPGPDDWRELEAADIAVLTRTNRQAAAVRDALRAAGVPSVVAGLDTVFVSDAAAHWLRLLEALQEPASRSRAVAAALTPFMGVTPLEAASQGEPSWEAVHERLHRWAAVLANQGVASLYRAVTAEEGLPARVLAQQGGERMVTDMGHVAELLHAESAEGGLGAAAMRAWLAERIRSAGDEQSDAEERSRRLDSDAEAVQVLTVHRAKGLEFAVVYCPYLWDPLQTDGRSGPVLYHDPEAGDTRTLDVGCPGEDRAARSRYEMHLARSREEERGEDLRVLYVALTRARHQVVLSWGRAQHSGRSPLGRLLLARDPRTGEVDAGRNPQPGDRLIRAALEGLAGAAPQLISVEPATGPGLPGTAGPGLAGAPDQDLMAATFDRPLDQTWRRASYTSITAAAHSEPGDLDLVASEAEDPGVGDEPAAPGAPAAPLPPEDRDLDAALPVPLGAMPGGPGVGTFVHRVLERADFAAVDVDAELTVAVADASRRGRPEGDLSMLADGLGAALSTPLGPLLPGVTLRDVRRVDRLDELAFELPLAGGERPVGGVSTADLAALVGSHLQPGGPLRGYGERLADPLLATTLRGYLTGSLDLVFRRAGVGGNGADEKWFVADYKTNWLGEPDRPLTAWHYRPAALDAEMQRRHYPLQALLYLVALHRYLRWRRPGYRPEVHLGGVLYLFVRGMLGPDSPVADGQTCGVFSWLPPPALVLGLSELLEAGR